MNELIAQVSQKTGLTFERSALVIQVVIGFLKARLPSPIAGQIDSLLHNDIAEIAGHSRDSDEMDNK